jgi:hypothetical protein
MRSIKVFVPVLRSETEIGWLDAYLVSFRIGFDNVHEVGS